MERAAGAVTSAGSQRGPRSDSHRTVTKPHSGQLPPQRAATAPSVSAKLEIPAARAPGPADAASRLQTSAPPALPVRWPVPPSPRGDSRRLSPLRLSLWSTCWSLIDSCCCPHEHWLTENFPGASVDHFIPQFR